LGITKDPVWVACIGLKAALHSQLLYQDRVRDRMRQTQGSASEVVFPKWFFAPQHGRSRENFTGELLRAH